MSRSSSKQMVPTNVVSTKYRVYGKRKKKKPLKEMRGEGKGGATRVKCGVGLRCEGEGCGEGRCMWHGREGRVPE